MEIINLPDEVKIKIRDDIVLYHTDNTKETIKEPDPRELKNYECERFVEKMGYAWSEWKSLCVLYSEGNGPTWRRMATEMDMEASEAKLERLAKASEEYHKYLRGWRTAEKLEKDYYCLYMKWQNHYKTKLRLMEIFARHGKAY